MSDLEFVHLHVHTEYSLLDGLSNIDQLVERAKALNMPALAITDHGTMFGVMDFFRACKQAGVKPIIGVESYLARRSMHDNDPQLDKRAYHMLLLAKNQTGYQNLLKIASAAQLEGFYYRPRIDREFLAQHAEGLVATSGCLAAQIPTMVMDGKDNEARELVGWYQEVFGKENFYLELQQHDIPELETLNKWILEYRKSHHTDVPLLATNDVHYVMKDDADPHDTLLCIQTSSLKSDSNRLRMSDASYYVTSQQEMWGFFGKEAPEALKNTLKVAEMCEADLDTQGYHLPVFPVPEGYTSETYLRHLCLKGLAWRFDSRASDTPLTERVDRELSIIHNMGFETYFLIVWDLCQYARHADIWWNVRGSGAGSLVAYSLGITNIDPIQNNLLFERFLNPGRVSMPDIDLDYPDDRRGEMISYTARKYGEDKVAAIITFGTMGAKAAVRDVGRALNVPLEVVNKAVRLIPTEAKQKRLEEYVRMNPELEDLYNSDEQIQLIIDTAKSLQGVSRHASTHAAGVIVADRPLMEYLPLHRITGTDPSGGALKAVTQFPMETCESIGLLKIDFLGLSTLTIMRKACELIERYHGIKYTMDNIPYRHDDERLTDEQRKMLSEAFELIGRGETVGVFQVESGGMQQMLRGMRPSKFEHIIAAISLYRPGPMDYIPTYNNRMHGKEPVVYHHKKMEKMLAETYGILVYQEQIMQVAGELFGYELGEADLMRKAVSKKKEKDLILHKEIFMRRGPEHGVDSETAEKIFADIEFFANYGFNKAHASDYAVITVQTAYLKAHYPEEYVTALLSVHRDDSDKISTFLDEARRLSIPILPPDVNHSLADFDIQPVAGGKRGIRFGMAAVKNAGLGPVQHILEARKEGAFKSLEDLCRRVDMRVVQKRALESLIKVGALDKLGDRVQMAESVDRLVNFSIDHHRAKEIGQMSLFGEATGVSDSLALPAAKEVSVRAMLGWEKELLGLYVTGRPTDRHREELRQSGTEVIQELKADSPGKHGKNVRVAGEVVSLRKIITKNGQVMAVAQLEDWHETSGSIEVVLFPRTWDKHHDDVDEGRIIMVIGKFDASRETTQIICEKVITNFDIMTADESRDSYDNDVPEWALSSDENYVPEPPAWVAEEVAVPTSSNGNGSTQVSDDGQEYDEETGEVSQPEPISIPAPIDAVAPATQGAAAVPVPAVEPQLSAEPEVNDDVDSPYANSEESVDAEHWLVVRFPRSEDPNVDRRRLRKLHGLLVSYPGSDRFTIVIDGPKKKSSVLEFPNHTTGYCEDLQRDLAAGNYSIEVYSRPE